jgi:PAS domain S-box-containing protein
VDNRDKRKQHDIDERVEKLAYIPISEFVKVSADNVQSLLKDLCTHLKHTELVIEELQKAKTKLDDAQKECTDLYEFAPVGYFNLDSHGDIVRVNITACDMLNMQKNALLNRPFIDLVEINYRYGFNDFLNDLVQSQSRLSTEVEMLRGDGGAFFAQIQAIPLYEKAYIIFRLSIADITKLKEAESAKRQSEERLRSVFQTMDEGFALCEMVYDDRGNPVDFRYLEVNPAFARQSGLLPDQVIGRTVKSVIPSIESTWIETFDKVVKTGQSQRIKNRVAGLNKTFEVHAWRSGQVQFGVVFRDVEGYP